MDQNLRTNIKKTAAKLFLKYGLRSVSIDDICNELRISKKTFYTHFSQKEELIESVLTEHNEKRLKKQESKTRLCDFTGNAIDQIMQASAFHNSPKNDQFMNFFYDLHKYYPETHKRITQRNHEHTCEKIRENIQTGMEEHLFRSDFDVELMVRFLAVQFITMMNLTSKDFGKTSMRRGFGLILDIYIRVLCNRQGLDYYEELLSKKSQEKHTDDEPLRDDELDQMINQIMDAPDDILKIVKD
ncbi:MAG: TetR/AcrR family transcriptional regulator [Bacteroidales bacterium]|nr:TetR/AcrR family transcriptional regulator [Bacteroidales bacterium]